MSTLNAPSGADSGVAPLRIVRRPEDGYSCRGVEPYGVQRESHVLPRSGLTVHTAVLAWREDPRGGCGACPGCKAILWPNGVWSATHATD
jgi:hypothetical protein